MLDASGMLDWVKRANPGDVAVYARGAALPRQVATLAAQMQAQGLVDLTRRREGAGWRFMIQRRTSPFRLIAGRRRVRSYGCGSAETVMLRMIRNAIRWNQPCPTNREFAEAAGLSGGVAASYRLRKLVQDGKIALIDFGPYERRVATDLRSGRSTVRAAL